MKNSVAEEITGKYNITIFRDENPFNPREDESVFTMVCWHKRYNLGDEQPKNNPDEWLQELACEVDDTAERRIDWWENEGFNRLSAKHSVEEAIKISNNRIKAVIEKTIADKIIMLPLYLYDHSGLSISTSSFNDRWDSGWVGWIYITKQKARELNYDWERLSAKRIRKIQEYLRLETKEYDSYLNGGIKK